MPNMMTVAEGVVQDWKKDKEEGKVEDFNPEFTTKLADALSNERGRMKNQCLTFSSRDLILSPRSLARFW